MSLLTKNPIVAPLVSAWLNRQLLIGMAKREVLARYKGSWFGLLWSLLTPILLLLVYMFVFGLVFKARWPEAENLPEGFSSLLFCGLMAYLMFSEILTRSPNLIIDNVNYVKKVVFPLDILSWVAIAGAIFHFMLSTVVLLSFTAIWGAGLHWQILYLPLLLVVFTIFLLGLSWLLSALGVFIRDVSYVAGFLATAFMFLSPIFYPKSAVPEDFARIMDYNPLTFYIEQFRNVLVLGVEPDLSELGQALFIAVLLFIVGYSFFIRVKKGFADVL
ncbi:MAG: ABC transporter permease [Cellvibrionaceae bacterium]|nr:ABC transporter permease [Cellvibrionaceae bacterium]